MDKLTTQLFPNFPREIAFPWRKTVYNLKQFKEEISINNGLSDIYTSVYGSNFLINKIFFDLDYGPDVLGDAKKIFEYITIEKRYQAIPIVSGKKGYHIYVIVKPEIHKHEAGIRLLRAHYSIIQSVFGTFKQERIVTDYGKEVSVLRNKDRIIGPDPVICGDVKRISRVPNTLRPPENRNYCTYLPPDKFLDMTVEDVICHMKSPHTYDIKIDYLKAPELTTFTYEFDKNVSYNEWVPIETPKIYQMRTEYKFLKGLLRPCVYRHITSMHPTNDIRYCATLDLLSLGLDVDAVLNIYSNLGWEDFVEEKTRKKIIGIQNTIKTKNRKPWSCGKLRSKKIPRVCCID